MNNVHKMWQTIYYLVNTEGYEITSIDENHEIWLTHENKRTVKRFILRTPTHQEVDFDFNKLKDNIGSLIDEVGFTIQKIDCYYITDKSLDLYGFRQNEMPSIKYDILSHSSDFEKVPSHFIAKKQIKHSKLQPISTYKNKLFNSNFIDKFMLKFSPATYILILINVLIWLFLILTVNHFSQNGLVELGGLVHFNVAHGEWYRLITSMFLHSGFTHILMNMFSLLIFGKLIEGALGSAKMLIIYFVSGIFAGLLSISIDTVSISVGASGAIFGLIGAFIVYLFTRPNLNKQFVFQTLIGIVVLSLLTLFISNVNHFAHIGGFLGGAIVMYLIYIWQINHKFKWLYVAIFIFLIAILFLIIMNREQHNIYDQLTEDMMEKGEFKKAEAMIDDIKKKHYESDNTYILSGLLIASDKSLDEAILEWEKGLKIYPKSSRLNYQIALGYRGKDKYDEANKYLTQAIKLDNKKKYQDLKDEIDKFRR